MTKHPMKSRKLWLGIFTFLIHVVAAAFGAHIPVEASAGLLGSLASEGLADALGALRRGSRE